MVEPACKAKRQHQWQRAASTNIRYLLGTFVDELVRDESGKIGLLGSVCDSFRHELESIQYYGNTRRSELTAQAAE